MSEYAKLWRNDNYKNIELLSATFKKFSYSKHWHDELSIGLIQKGVEALDFKGSKINIPQGHIVAINPSEVHTGYSGSKEGWTYRMFYFDVKLIESILEEHSSSNSVIINSPIIKDVSLYQNLLKLHMSLEEQHFDLTKDSLLIMSIVELFNKHGDVKRKETLEYKDLQTNNKAKEYLIDNCSENISLDELSLFTQRDKYQLIRNFKSQFGITPHQFLVQLKTKNAKVLLEKGASITQTALECGFFDQSHFTKNFKSLFGVTPGLYINSLK